MTDDLPMHYPDESAPTRNGAQGRKCPRHSYRQSPFEGEGVVCWRCGRPADKAASRRGRTARNRGNAFERDVARQLGGRRVGQYGDKVDVDVPGYLRAQCKVGASYPERIDGWLRAIPVEAGLLRAVVLGDAPGSAGKRRTLIVMDLAEYAAWHGKP
jgi:hypothetical protein